MEYNYDKVPQNRVFKVQSVKGRQSRVVERHSRVQSVKGCQTRVVERETAQQKGFSTSKYVKTGFRQC